MLISGLTDHHRLTTATKCRDRRSQARACTHSDNALAGDGLAEKGRPLEKLGVQGCRLPSLLGRYEFQLLASPSDMLIGLRGPAPCHWPAQQGRLSPSRFKCALQPSVACRHLDGQRDCHGGTGRAAAGLVMRWPLYVRWTYSATGFRPSRHRRDHAGDLHLDRMRHCGNRCSHPINDPAPATLPETLRLFPASSDENCVANA